MILKDILYPCVVTESRLLYPPDLFKIKKTTLKIDNTLQLSLNLYFVSEIFYSNDYLVLDRFGKYGSQLRETSGKSTTIYLSNETQ